MRSSVVLPQPDGPRITTSSPAADLKLVGASAWTGSSCVLNHLSTPASDDRLAAGIGRRVIG